jgi:hypothetical protein
MRCKQLQRKQFSKRTMQRSDSGEDKDLTGTVAGKVKTMQIMMTTECAELHRSHQKKKT